MEDMGTTDILEKEAMAKLFNESMPDEIVPSEKEEIVDRISEIDFKIGSYINNKESLDIISYEEKETNFTPGKIEIYKSDTWEWQGLFCANVLGDYQNGKILDYPEIIYSNQLSNVEKIDILEKLIYEKQLELLSIKDYIIENLLFSLIKKFLIDASFERWNQLGFFKIIDIDKLSLDDKSEKNIYNHFKTLVTIANYNKDISEIVDYININNMSKIIVPIEASFDLMYSLFECLIAGERCYFILYDNNEFKEWN